MFFSGRAGIGLKNAIVIGDDWKESDKNKNNYCKLQNIL